MTGKEQPSLIGFDPLALVSDEEEIGSVQEQEIAVEVSQQDVSEDVEFTENSVEIDSEAVSQFVRTGTIVLDEELHIQDVGVLYERLLSLLETYHTIEIDAASVRVVDTATLQLLVVLKQEAIKLGKEIVFDFPSECFIEAAQLLGLDTLLNVDQPESGLF